MSKRLVLCAVGDVFIDRNEPKTAFAGVKDIFASADVRFGNCEAVYTSSGERFPKSGTAVLSEPTNFEGVKEARFDVMSYANNHALDGGYGGFFDTINLLRDAGIGVVGAGRNLEEARQPVFVNSHGVTVGFVAYTCVYPPGFEAGHMKAGCATLTVHTAYRGELGQPGTRPLVSTFLDAPEKATVMADIERARREADLLVVSVHWGIHALPAELADYERELGHAAIDAGADLILGHHQHIMKGVEVYRGKPIFYGLGNFAFDFRPLKGEEGMTGFNAFYGDYALGTHADSVFHPESRKTMLVRCVATPDGLSEAVIVPCLIDDTGTPTPLRPASPDFGEFVEYLQSITTRASLNGRFIGRDNEIVVAT